MLGFDGAQTMGVFLSFFQSVKPFIQVKSEHQFKRNETIYHEGDEARQLYFIKSGIIGLFHISESGKKTFFRVFGKNDILGHRSYFANEPHHASSVALSDVSLVFISKDECLRICQENPQLLREVTSQLAIDLGKAELRMAGLLDKTAHKRISESLVFLKLKYPAILGPERKLQNTQGVVKRQL